MHNTSIEFFFRVLVSHLLHQILLVIFVDLLNSTLKSFIFFFPIALVSLPHFGLMVNVRLFILLALLFLFNLLCQELSHFFLLLSHSLGPLFFKLPLSHFSLVIILGEHFFFESLSIGHLLEDVVRHFIHKVLCTLLSATHFLLPVRLLLIEHTSIVFLRFKII